MISYLSKSLIDAAKKILGESKQQGSTNIRMSDRSVEKMANQVAAQQKKSRSKPSQEESIANHEDEIWKHAKDLHGSSTLLPHTDPDDLKFDPLFYRRREQKWEYGLKEKGFKSSSVKNILTTHHFLDRATDDERNYKQVTGSDLAAFKKRIIDHIDKNELVSKSKDQPDGMEHHFLSTTNPGTKGYAVVTRIHPDGNVHLVTLLDPTMQGDGNEKKYRSLVESMIINKEFILVEID